MSILNVLKGAAAEVDPFDSGDTYSTYNSAPKTVNLGSYSANNSNPAALAPDTTSASIAALNKQIAQEQANYNALSAQIAAQPKLPYYNTAAAYASAQTAATAAVDPVYQDKLTQYLQQEQLTTTQNTNEEQTDVAANNTTLANQTADNATAQQRAQEDQSTNLTNNQEASTNYQANNGTAFDAARTALLGSVANSGLTSSGLGQSKVASATADRNVADNQEQQGVDNTTDAINTTANRTFQDIATSNTRNTAANASSNAEAATTLQNYIDNANLAEQSFRTSNEEAEQGAIASTAQNDYQQGVQQFIASLEGSGARAQDIALAAQVYGA